LTNRTTIDGKQKDQIKKNVVDEKKKRLKDPIQKKGCKLKKKIETINKGLKYHIKKSEG
jgi:uncharacterized FlaG/YvyC family protein